MESVWVLLISITLVTALLVIATKYLLRKPTHRPGRWTRLQRYVDSRKEMDRHDPRHKALERRWYIAFAWSLTLLLVIQVVVGFPYFFIAYPFSAAILIYHGRVYWKAKLRLLHEMRPPAAEAGQSAD